MKCWLGWGWGEEVLMPVFYSWLTSQFSKEQYIYAANLQFMAAQ